MHTSNHNPHYARTLNAFCCCFTIVLVIVFLLLILVSARTNYQVDIVDIVRSNNPNLSNVERQVEEGQWYSVDGNRVAVISSALPVSVLLSEDGGRTWHKSIVESPPGGTFLPESEERLSPACGFIEINQDGTGCLVLGNEVSTGTQKSWCFLTEDAGKSWVEIPSVSNIHGFAVTGAGYSNKGILCVAFRYYENGGPDIWYTADRGITWCQSSVEDYSIYDDQFRFTPRCLSFDGLRGECEVLVYNCESQNITEARLYSENGGQEWRWDKMR